VRHHALPDAAFAELAAGRPSAATLEELRRAQLSKHLLLLRAILQAAGAQAASAQAADPQAADPQAADPQAADPQAAGSHWCAELLAADPAVVRSFAADPLSGAWAAGCLAALHGGASPAEAGLERLTELTTTRQARPNPRDLGVVAPHKNPRTPQKESHNSKIGGRWGLRADRDGLAIEVRLEDADPVRGRLGLTPTGRLTGDAVAHWQACLDEAWQLLVDRHRPAAETLATVLSVIVPVEPDPAAHGISATSAHAFGAVAMSAPRDGTELAVGLLHESRHSVLNAVEYLFDLHTDPAALGYSPWRDDPRPASGILHGAYAYLAVTRFWRIEAVARVGPAGALAAFEYARWRSAVVSSAEELLAGGDLTPAGTRFVGALRDEVLPWLDEPVPPAVARLAASANADHYLRWRLRNLTVDPAAVHRSVAAWHRGDPEPPAAPPARLVPAPRRALEHSNRLALTHRLLRGGEVLGAVQPGAPPTAGDLAYLRGDHGTARDAYVKRVETDPADDAGWAGLALVSPRRALREQPELVAAVFRAVETADADSLAEWISG
jgi:hypothetical protein